MSLRVRRLNLAAIFVSMLEGMTARASWSDAPASRSFW
ncbi:hypothetical protein 7712_00084 [Pseudomonas phage bmx-p2]|nr:hypothetical protein 7712_00084 [Pseudomonas phage bmx-p2]